MATKYPAALPQASSLGGYYNQVNAVQRSMGTKQIPNATRRTPAQTYQPNALQNALAFLRGRK
jgi:hypothetical protein